MLRPSNHTLVAERDGAVVGVALVTQAGKLSLCYVLPEVQHAGVGKALLHGVEAQARESPPPDIFDAQVLDLEFWVKPRTLRSSARPAASAPRCCTGRMAR
jgi:GNAT superfamily N-acetyltransferase